MNIKFSFQLYVFEEIVIKNRDFFYDNREENPYEFEIYYQSRCLLNLFPIAWCQSLSKIFVIIFVEDFNWLQFCQNLYQVLQR